MAGHGRRTAARLGAHSKARSRRADPVRPCRRFRRRTGLGAGQRSTARVGLVMSESTRQATRVSVITPVSAVLSATAAATAIWAVATMAGAALTVSYAPGQPINITAVNVVMAALVGSLAGWGLLGLLRRFTPKARAVCALTAIFAALF